MPSRPCFRREITTSSGYQTFSLVDLMEPDPKRCVVSVPSSLPDLWDRIEGEVPALGPMWLGCLSAPLLPPAGRRTKRILSALLTYNDFRVARARSYEQALLTLVCAARQPQACGLAPGLCVCRCSTRISRRRT